MSWEDHFLERGYQAWPPGGCSMESTEVTLDKINGLGLEIKRIREAKDDLKKKLEYLNGQLRELETEFIAYLEANGMDKYSVPGYGTAYLQERLSYKVPKEPEQRQKFFDFLKSRGVYEDMVTVHSQTLNSWAKKELEIAQSSNGIDDFEIPGLGLPNYSRTLGVRKA